MLSLRRGHANLLCIVPILVYVLPKQALINFWELQFLGLLLDFFFLKHEGYPYDTLRNLSFQNEYFNNYSNIADFFYYATDFNLYI